MDPFWLSRDEVRELDRRAIEDFGVPGIVLMENAGRGCAELLMRLNPDKKPVVIPSGLDCDAGEPLGPTVKATHTATFVAHKKGFLNSKSREWTGAIHVIDIGAPRVLVDEYRRKREAQ